MKTQRERYSRPEPAKPSPAPKRAPTAGTPLPDTTRARMGAAFGHDFSQVRVFADSAAAESAQDLSAKAYTVDSDIFFNDNFYDPHGSEGQKLLAHELTHVVQQDRNGSGRARADRDVSDPADASEREAEAVSEQVAAGGSVQVQAAPSAVASRGLLDWVEDKASSAAGAVGDAASGAWDGAKSVASDAADAVGSAASTAWDGTKTAASAVGGAIADEAKQEYAGMKMLGGYVKQGEEAVGHGIDWVEDKEKAGTSWVADKAKGIPVLEQVANAGKSFVDTQTELTGGVARGVTGLVGGVAGMVANPVDTAKGLEAMAEHIPIIPGMPNPLKAAHGLLNVATGDETMGQFGGSLNPMESMKNDGEFWKTVGGGLVGQYSEQWKEGKYADVVGHAGFDIGSLFLGAGEANAAGKLGEAAKLADAAKLGEAADLAKLGDAGKLGEAADASKLADAAKAGDAADLAKADDAANVTRDVTKADDAANATRAEDAADASKVGDAKSPADFSDKDIDDLVNGLDDGKGSSGNMFELPGQNPKTGEGLSKYKIKADEAKDIAYHQNMEFKGIKDAPGGKAEVRYHSENPNAPEGSYSHDNPTVQINSGNKYRLPNGEYKPIGGMTDAERDLAHYRTTSAPSLGGEIANDLSKTDDAANLAKGDEAANATKVDDPANAAKGDPTTPVQANDPIKGPEVGQGGGGGGLGEPGGTGGTPPTPEEYLIQQAQAEFERLEGKADPALEGTEEFLSKKKRGPNLSSILDTKDPDMTVHHALNDAEKLPPKEMSDVVKKRVEAQQEAWQQQVAEIEKKDPAARTEAEQRILSAGPPGSHSEAHSLDAAVKAREARTGAKVTEEDLPDFMLHNTDLGNKHLGEAKPRCYNCNPITDGVTLTSPLQEVDDIFHKLFK